MIPNFFLFDNRMDTAAMNWRKMERSMLRGKISSLCLACLDWGIYWTLKWRCWEGSLTLHMSRDYGKLEIWELSMQWLHSKSKDWFWDDLVRPTTPKSSLIRGLTKNEQKKLRSRSQWDRKKTRRWLWSGNLVKKKNLEVSDNENNAWRKVRLTI